MSVDRLAESKSMLLKYGLSLDVLDAYTEPHRKYHTFDHLNYMLNRFPSVFEKRDMLHLAVLYHDVVYNPHSTTNESDSARYFRNAYEHRSEYGAGMLTPDEINEICVAIEDTKSHESRNSLSDALINLDLYVLRYGELEEFIDYDRKIFKEYQFVDFKVYKEKRYEILKKLGAKHEFLTYFNAWQPKIAVYAGSFNPFHVGHLDVLMQAERTFDKVIVARGKNPDKNNEFTSLPKWMLHTMQVDCYDGLLTDYLDSLGYPVTLVRGLRNADDFASEQTQLAYLRYLQPMINVVFYMSHPENAHVSSSAIRMLSKYGKGRDLAV